MCSHIRPTNGYGNPKVQKLGYFSVFHMGFN